MIPTFEEFLNSYYEKNNMVLLPFGYYADRITQSSIDNDSDDVKLVKDAIELLRLQKGEIIQKRKKIDTIRFWIFSTVVPAIPLFFLFFYLVGLDVHGSNSYMYTHPEESHYFLTIISTVVVTTLFSFVMFVFQLKRDKRHYDLETDKTTNLLNDINYNIDILEKSL